MGQAKAAQPSNFIFGLPSLRHNRCHSCLLCCSLCCREAPLRRHRFSHWVWDWSQTASVSWTPSVTKESNTSSRTWWGFWVLKFLCLVMQNSAAHRHVELVGQVFLFRCVLQKIWSSTLSCCLKVFSSTWWSSLHFSFHVLHWNRSGCSRGLLLQYPYPLLLSHGFFL